MASDIEIPLDTSLFLIKNNYDQPLKVLPVLDACIKEMAQQIKNLVFLLIIFLINNVDCSSLRNNNKDIILNHPLYFKNYLDYEKGLIYKSLKQIQDSIALVNNNLFTKPVHNPNLYSNLYFNFQNNLLKKRIDLKPKLSRRNGLELIKQLNKEIIKNQLMSYEQMLSKLKFQYDPSLENRQAINLIKTLFRFPVLLLFSNIFQLPLLPTLILASPFLNGQETASNALSNSLNKNFLSSFSSAGSNSAQSTNSITATPATQASINQQTSAHLPFSLNPLVPINQLLNNFMGEIVSDIQSSISILQNTPVFNNFLQSVGQVLANNKPNRPNQFQNSFQNQPQPPLPIQSHNQNLTKPVILLNSTDLDLLTANASTVDFTYQVAPPDLPNKPLIGPEPGSETNSLLDTLANTLLQTNKNHQLTETLGVNNGGSMTELATNTINTLATMLRIKKQKKELNSNEEMLFNFLTSKNYLEYITSIGNLLKMGLKQKSEKDMNLCLVRTICESNQRSIGFAFDQLFKLAMHVTGFESRMEKSPYHMYYQIGRKMIKEQNVCKLIPKKKSCEDDEGDKSLAEKKLNLLEKIEKIQKIEELFSRRRESRVPDFQKTFRVMKKARKLRFAKRLFNKSFRRVHKLGRRMARLIF